VASIKGGEIPFDPMSLRWPLATPSDKRYLADPDLEEKAQHSLKIDDLDFTQYDLVYMAGGWGAAYDLGTSEVLGRKLESPARGLWCRNPLKASWWALQASSSTASRLHTIKRCARRSKRE
jgi:hypothetical protein